MPSLNANSVLKSIITKVISLSGVQVPNRPNLNFTGAGVTVTDNPGTDSTDVAISGSGGGGGVLATATTQGEVAAWGGAVPVGAAWMRTGVSTAGYAVPAHGNLTSGSLHALAGTSAAGFAPTTAGKTRGNRLALDKDLLPTWLTDRALVPEDFVATGTTEASIDTAGTWDTYINTMLSTVAASSLIRVASMTPGRDYKCSGEISFPLGVRIWEGNGAAITGNYDAIGVDFDNVHPSYWIEVRNLTLKQNNANTTFAWRLNNCSYIRLSNCSVENYGGPACNNIIGFAITGSANNHHIELIRPWVDDIKGNPGDGANQATAISILPSGSIRHTINVIDPIVTGYGATKVAMTIDGATKGITVQNPQFRGLFGGAFTVGYSGAATEAQISGGYIVDADLGGIYHLGTGRLEVDGIHVDACGGGYASIGEGAISSGNTGLTRVHNSVVTRAGKTSAGATRSATSANGFYSPTTVQTNWDLQGNRVEDSVGYNYRLMGVKTAKIHNNTGKNPGYGLGSVTASFYVQGKSDAISNVSISGNTAYDPATGLGGGFSIGPGAAAYPMIGNVQNNHSYGNGVSGGTGFSCVVDGIVEGNHAYNHDRGFYYVGVGLGRTCFFRGNVLHTCATGFVGDIAGGSTWLYLEGNTYINTTTRFAFSGAGAARVKEAIQLFPKRIILSNAAPVATEEKWDLNDEIRPATAALTTNEVARYCTVASVDYSDVGTWMKVVGVTP